MYVVWVGFPGGSVLKNPPVKQKTWVQSLSQEDPLEKEMATHSSIVALEIPWTEKPGGLQSMESNKNQRWLSREQQLNVALEKNAQIISPQLDNFLQTEFIFESAPQNKRKLLALFNNRPAFL